LGITGPNDILTSNPQFLEYIPGEGQRWTGGENINPGDIFYVELKFNITQLTIYGY
jgi:hypothetical protein